MKLKQRRSIQGKIIRISKSADLSAIQKAEGIVNLLAKVPGKFHIGMIEDLILSFYGSKDISGDFEKIKAACVVSAEDVLLAKDSHHVKSFLKSLYLTLKEDSLKKIAETISSFMEGENSSDVCSVVIIEDILCNLKECVIHLPRLSKSKYF